MFARIVPVRDGKVVINGKEYTLDEVKDLKDVIGIAKDDKGETYVVLNN